MSETYVAELRDINNRSYSYGTQSFEALNDADAGAQAFEWATSRKLGTTVRLVVKPRDGVNSVFDKVIYPAR